MGGGKGAVVGGVIGGVIGLIAGPPGVVVGAAAGAAVGGLTAKFVDAGLPDERLREIGEGLQPNTSAIVAIVDQVWVAEAERQMQEAGAKTVTAALSADIAKQLAEGKEVAYSAVQTDDAIGIKRVAGAGGDGEISDVVATKDGVYVDNIVKKGDDVKVTAGIATAEGAVVMEGEGKLSEVQAETPAQVPAETKPAEQAKPADTPPPDATPPAAATT
jgi:hypothetical protein